MYRYKDGAVFEANNSSGELKIKSLQLKHHGEYYCNVLNRQGGKAQSHTATITVGEYMYIHVRTSSAMLGEIVLHPADEGQNPKHLSRVCTFFLLALHT